MLSHHRGGSGEPLLLVHGIGSHWHVWEPVLPLLERSYDVVAVDLPGFGESAALDDGADVSALALAGAVGDFASSLGLSRFHVAGNSLGGWIALELAKTGRTLSACALSPAGFAESWEIRYLTASLAGSRTAAKRLAPWVDALYARPAVRRALMSQLVARPERMRAAAAAQAMRNLAASPGWDATLAELARGRFAGGAEVQRPVTVAWGEKDRLLLLRQADRARAELPQARHLILSGCGHVPTWDDPELVARAIESSAIA